MILGFATRRFRYVSEHGEPRAFRRDFYALSQQDLAPSDRLYVFPPPGSVRAAASKLLHLAAAGVLVAFEAEAAKIPEFLPREPSTLAGSNATGVQAEDPRDWFMWRGDGRVRAGVGPWAALGAHAGWWPLPSGAWAQREESDPPGAEELEDDPDSAAGGTSAGGGGGREGKAAGGLAPPGQLVAIFFAFPSPLCC